MIWMILDVLLVKIGLGRFGIPSIIIHLWLKGKPHPCKKKINQPMGKRHLWVSCGESCCPQRMQALQHDVCELTVNRLTSSKLTSKSDPTPPRYFFWGGEFIPPLPSSQKKGRNLRNQPGARSSCGSAPMAQYIPAPTTRKNGTQRWQVFGYHKRKVLQPYHYIQIYIYTHTWKSVQPNLQIGMIYANICKYTRNALQYWKPYSSKLHPNSCPNQTSIVRSLDFMAIVLRPYGRVESNVAG